jgi:hypothetical protein
LTKFFSGSEWTDKDICYYRLNFYNYNHLNFADDLKNETVIFAAHQGLMMPDFVLNFMYSFFIWGISSAG